MPPGAQGSETTGEQIMNDMPRSGAHQTESGVPAWDLAIVSSDAVHKFSNQGQVVAKAMMDWNAECSRFLTHRISNNSEAAGQIAKCNSLPEMFAVHTKWLQTAVKDYVKQATNLMEINSNVMTSVVSRAGGQSETHESAAAIPTKVEK